MVACAALLACAGPAVAQDVVVNGTAIDTGCGEPVYHLPGPPGRIDGVLYNWFDTSGFVFCASDRDCARVIELQSVDYRFADPAWDDFLIRTAAMKRNIYGTWRIAFDGRRGSISRRPCADHGQSDLPEYVQIDRLVSLRPLDQRNSPQGK